MPSFLSFPFLRFPFFSSLFCMPSFLSFPFLRFPFFSPLFSPLIVPFPQRLGSLSYFAGAEKKDDRVLVPDLGSLTSIYDRSLHLPPISFLFPFSLLILNPFRFPLLGLANCSHSQPFSFSFVRARELFYYLKGGRVDYGEEHSNAYGHSQFGRLYEPGFISYLSPFYDLNYYLKTFASIALAARQPLSSDPKWYLQDTILNGMKTIPFTLLAILPERRSFEYSSKCSPTRLGKHRVQWL